MYFSLSGTLNRHTCRIWSQNNPHTISTTTLHSPQLCVWMGLSSQFGLTPYFVNGTVNSENYLSMLQNHVIPQLKQRRAFSRTIFMQDQAPPHYASSVREFLNKKFPSRVISRGCDIAWPARSPDLNPLDFWFWGMLKAKIYHHSTPHSLEHLQQLITEACSLDIQLFHFFHFIGKPVIL